MIYLLLLLFSIHYIHIIIAESTPEITTLNGKIVGEVISVQEEKIYVFKGVPFAKPPIGELRFALTQPVDNWETLNAIQQPPLCVQMRMNKTEEENNLEKHLEGKEIVGGFIKMVKELSEIKQESEDCLYMNIYAPSTIQPFKSDEKPDTAKKIVVLIHGGAFFTGGVSIESMDASVFSAFGDVIVAVPQFRLGVLGFLNGGTTRIPGNAGLFDQLEAIKWLSQNAHAFGASNKLILMGFDSGGWSAGFHLLSHQSQPFIERVIMQSGSSLSPIMLFGESSAIARFEKFVNATGCLLPEQVNEKNTFIPDDRTYKCLEELSIEKILDAQNIALSSKKDVGFVPNEDKNFFQGNPFDIAKSGKFGDIKEILMGTNSNEGGILLTSTAAETYPPFNDIPKKATLNDLIEIAKSKGAKSNAGQLQMMLPMFFRGVDKKNPQAVRERLLALCADGLFVCPDLLLLQSYVKAGGNLYYYRFDYKPSKSPFASWLEGAQHMDELQYVLGRPFLTLYAEKYTDNEKKMSKKLIELWSNFIKKGVPEGVQWKPNQAKERYYLQIKEDDFKQYRGFPKNLCKDLTRYYSMGRSFLKTYKP